MEVLSESTVFSPRDSRESLPASVLMINFRRLKAQRDKTNDADQRNGRQDSLDVLNHSDVFHSIAGLYSAALPDMELDAIYGSLAKPTRTILVMATDEAVRLYRNKHGPPKLLKVEERNSAENEEDEYSDPYCNLYSDSDDDEKNGGQSEEESKDSEEDYEKEREIFLANIRERRQHQPTIVGIEEKLAGCITFMRLSSKPGESSVQVLLLAVRHRWRRYGVGQYLLSLAKDPAIVGQYDVILTYADHKAEEFFRRYGFNTDPIITTRYKSNIDHWENSTLMAYLPPYSTNTMTSLKSLQAMDKQIKKWRSTSIVSHCEQVCVMERLRQEVLVLQGRILSQEEIIDALQNELKQSNVQRWSLENEFKAYRQKMQDKLMCLMEERAKEWIDDVARENKDS